MSQYLDEICAAGGTLHNFKTGITYSEIEISCTIVIVIGYGKSLRIILPTTLLPELEAYQAIQSKQILTLS